MHWEKRGELEAPGAGPSPTPAQRLGHIGCQEAQTYPGVLNAAAAETAGSHQPR